MRGTFDAKKCVFALLLTCCLVRSSYAAEQDFDDGVVEDVQEETQDVSDAGEEIQYESPKYDPRQFYFVDPFDDIEDSKKRWIKSKAKKVSEEGEAAKYDGEWNLEPPQRIVWKNDIGLVLKSNAKHAAIASRLLKPFTFKEKKPLLVQYEVTLQDGQECGGAYLKLLSAGKQTEDLTKFNDKTPYTIMFGPDKCGNDIKMHFIFRHVNPINGTISEKHAHKPKDRLEEPFKDKLPHLYQLLVKPDNTFEVRLDHNIINSGSLLTDFTPAVNPPREIDDPEDIKPKDWDEREKIPDPTAIKPEDWDDEAPPQIPDPDAVKPSDWLDDEMDMIPDPSARKPDDWDEEIDGEWEAPLVDNPVCAKVSGCGEWIAPLIPNKNYKGKWRAPMIDNPNYQGKWAPRKIPNPDFFEDLNPFRMTPIDAIGIELWSISRDILFDNLIITDDSDLAREFAAKTFDLKRKHIERESKTLWHRMMRHMNYKPGWWALYFLYLLIPASCYVCYLYRRAKESTFLNKALNYAAENPWFWRISLLVIVTLLAYAFYRLCSKKSIQETDESAQSAAAKKTDEVQQNIGDTAAVTKESSPKKKKSDLDVNEDQPASEEVRLSADRQSTADEDDLQVDETAEEGPSGVRKRRARKDES